MLAFETIATEPDAVQETLLGEAVEHAPVGAIVLDEHGHHLAANRAACRLSGYSREELLRRRPHDLAADPSTVPAKLQDMAAGRLVHGRGRLRRSDGSVLPIEYRVGATRSGGLPFFVMVFWQHDADES